VRQFPLNDFVRRSISDLSVYLGLSPLTGWRILVSSFVGLAYELLGEENIEINSRTLTIRKGIHGWERQREYQITECSDLRWEQGRKGTSYLTCKAGRWPIHFGNRVSEEDSIKILSALQSTLPDVAQQICASPASKEHFITLGLNKT